MQSGALTEGVLGMLGLSGGELVLGLVVLLVCFASNRWGGLRGFRRTRSQSTREAGESLGGGLGKPVADALTHSSHTWEIEDPPALRLRRIRKQMKNQLVLWIAQGFGAGQIPRAPGTFGSAVGLMWFAVLLLPGSPWVYAAGLAAGFLLSVRLCGAAERILSRTDPGSVVLDEIIAVPFCFAVWIGEFLAHHGSMPGPIYFVQRDTWPLTLAVFVAFRFFDVVKPWPVRQSQGLPGGWGITLDDVLAALYVNAVFGLVWWFRGGP